MLEQIKASAGSGKTYTLTRRFLQLLSGLDLQEQASGCAGACSLLSKIRKRGVFSEILAMTFTNKAAAEMKSRVLETLKDLVLAHAGTKPDNTAPEKNTAPIPASDDSLLAPAQAAAWLDLILKRYDSLNIRTIDSLLTLLVRLSAARLDLAPDFEVTFDDSAYLEPLYDELLDQATAGEAEALALFADCAAYYARQAAAQTRFRGFTPRGNLREYVLGALSKAQIKGRPPCTDEKLVRARLAEISERVATAAAQLEKLVLENSIALNQHFKSFLDKCLQYVPGTELPCSKYAHKASLCDCVLKKSKDQIDEKLEAAYAALSATMTAQDRRSGVYRSVLDLLPFAKACAILDPRLRKLRSASGKLTGTMLPGLAAEALSGEYGVSEACCRLGSRLSHLLIDEFQDTSREQWQAIQPLAVESLASGGSLRYVGDVKQAIYSWRGGDSSLFDEVARLPELRHMEPEPVFTLLEYNWRSAPQIVWHNNTFFSRLAEEECSLAVARALLPANHPPEELARAAEAIRRTFTDATQKIPVREQEHKQKQEAGQEQKNGLEQEAGVEGFVSIRRLDINDLADSSDNDPEIDGKEFRARTARALRELFLEDLLPRRKAGDIAVLTRSGEEAEFVAAELLALGVSIVTEHSFTLGQNPLIHRLIAFLRFMDYPGDDLNFWNFISGPECFGRAAGLEADSLDAWLSRVSLERKLEESLRGRPLYTFFRRDFPEVWSLLLEPFHNQAGLLSAYDAISELYDRYGLLRDKPYGPPNRQTADMPGGRHEQGRPDETQEAKGRAVWLRRFLELLHSAGRQAHSSPAAFLEFWTAAGSEEKIPLPETPDAVRIMTLHKAKGLEFPVVVMPFHRFSDSGQTEINLFDFEGQTWLVKDGPALGSHYYAQKRTVALEKLHLLYVGWTRAAQELHLFAGGSDYERAHSGLPQALDYLFGSFAFDERGFYQSGVRPGLLPAAPPETASTPEASHVVNETLITEQPENAEFFRLARRDAFSRRGLASSGLPPEEKSEQHSQTEISQRFPDEDWRPMRWLPRLKIFRNPVPETVYDERTRGLFLHACLENLYLPENNSLLEPCVRNAVDYTLHGFSLPFADLDKAKEEALQSLLWLCAQPGPRRWLQQGRREQALLGYKDEPNRINSAVVKNGPNKINSAVEVSVTDSAYEAERPAELRRVDLLVEEENELLLVEYKSGQPQAEHDQQLRHYLELMAASRCGQGKTLRGALIYLDLRRIEMIDNEI